MASVLTWSAPSTDFSSPAAAASFQTGGNMQLLPGDTERVNAILDGSSGILLAARSSSCSTRCSSSCSSGCSVRCSSSCSTRCSTSCSSSCSTRCGGSSTYTPSSSSSSRSTYRTTTRTVPAAPVVTKPQIQPDQPREIYWEDGYKWQIHNATCKTFAKGKGSPTVTPIGEDCPDCGGKTKKPLTDGTIKLVGPVSSSKPAAPETKTGETAKKEDTQTPSYWVTSSSGKIHNSTCRYYKNSNGYLTKSPQGTNCKICGGKDGK